MKTPVLVQTVICGCLFPVLLQDARGALNVAQGAEAVSAESATSDYQVVERGANHRVWARVTWQTNTTGKVVARTNSYTELASGMHYRDAAGNWQETREQIDLLPGAHGAAAIHGPRQVYFPADIYTGVIEIIAPDGKHLRSRPYGICYSDGTKTVLIAQLTNSVGLILPPGNCVTYTNAFSGLQADIVATYRRGSFECDLVLRERPLSPAEYGLDPASTRLQLLTEFYDTADPAVKPANPSRADGLTDATLDFGALKLGPGRAFSVGVSSKSGEAAGKLTRGRGMPVYKSWEKPYDSESKSCRTFLIEEVPYRQIKEQLNLLSAANVSGRWLASHTGGTGVKALGKLLPLRLPQTSTNELRIALNDLKPRSGVVLDYTTVDIYEEITDYTFKGNTTYLISGSVGASGTTTIEGGAVIKFVQPAEYCEEYGQWVVGGILNCTASPYHMAVLTSMDDDSVGERINGSNGNPSPNVWCESAYLCAGNVQLSNLRFAYAYYGLSTGGETHISNCQFVHCGGCGISNISDYEPSIVLHNVLFSGAVPVWFIETEGFSVTAENVTADAGAFVYGEYSSGVVSLTNSILTGIVKSANPNITVATNSVVVNAPATVFQTVGAGGYYLADNSPCRNVGTTNISPSLLAELRQRTSYPPIVYSNVLISADTSLCPQAQRDTDMPDLGYHYDPIDYACRATSLSNAVLQLLPGTALATFGTSYGLGVTIGSALVSEGTPTARNHIVRYNLVQEGASTNWNGRSGSVLGDWRGGAAPAQVRCRFTDWSTPAQDTCHYQDYYEQTLKQFVDCQFRGGSICVTMPSFNMTNCLLERLNLMLDDDIGSVDVSPVVRNCLFYGGTLTLGHYSMDTWLFRDNSFDQTQLSLDVGGSDLDSAHNAYLTNYDRLTPVSATDVIVTNFDWQAGWLGNYYLPTNSPLINTGSVTANLAGLYHYTTQTGQAKETNSVVDIGFHYVAVDTNGIPIDTDSDGVPDYLEDRNGDGDGTNDPTSWLIYNSPNRLSAGAGLQVFTPLK